MTRATRLRTVADAGLLIQLQAEAGAVPDWIQILPPAPIATRDNRGPYQVRDVEALIRVSMAEADGRLPIDENHSIDLAGPAGLASPAVGWIVEMQARDGAVWARVEWTEAGRRLVGDRAYRGISPVFMATKKDAEITHLLRASLTNTPNLRGLAALHHQENDHMEELLQQLAAALGLGEGADRAAIVARATDLNQRPAPAAELQSALTPIAKALGDGVAIEGAAILAAIGDLRDPTKVASTALVTELQSQIARLTEDQARDKATAFVGARIAAGARISQPLRDHYIARHMKDPAGVELELNALPLTPPGRMLATSPDPAAQPGTAAALDEVQLQAAKLLGLAPEAYAKALAAQQEAR